MIISAQSGANLLTVLSDNSTATAANAGQFSSALAKAASASSSSATGDSISNETKATVLGGFDVTYVEFSQADPVGPC